MHDLVIVGSGPAGFAAALACRGRNVLVVDPGYAPDASIPRGGSPLTELKLNGTIDRQSIIGSKFESLHNIHSDYLSPKIKGPCMRFITHCADLWTPVQSTSFLACLSLARGGLANAWGAGAFRYNTDELRSFPFHAHELDEFYETLTRYVGICGAHDDLEGSFGPPDSHLAPPRLGQAGKDLFSRTRRHREWLLRQGLRIGLPRLALLTESHRGQEPYAYDGLEFFYPHKHAIFNPGQAVLDLAEHGKVSYLPGVLVERFRTGPDHVEILGRHIADSSPWSLSAKKIALAAGAINTARIVLASASDHVTRIPIRDNPISYIPLLDPLRIGYPHDSNCLPAQGIMILENGFGAEPVQMSYYGLNTTLWGDVGFDMPLPAPVLSRAIRTLLPAMRIVQVFYPDTGDPRGYCRLDPQGHMEIEYRQVERGAVEKRMISLMRHLGYYGHSRLCKYPMAGNSFHYAGTIPMRKDPSGFEVAPDGSLANAPGVYVVDAAIFPKLPSKNLTLTIMANSMRIASRLAG